MSKPARPTVATHSIRYLIANALVMVAGFVSFPIMTRLLDTQQYGIFGYYDGWLMILVGIFKLGGQHGIIRFYPHVDYADRIGSYAANFIFAPYLSACFLWVLTLGVYAVIVLVSPPEAATIGWLMLAMLPAMIFVSYVSSYAGAIERSDISVRITVGQRWLELFAILTVVYFLQRSALGVYISRLGVALAFMLILAAWLRKHIPFSIQSFESSTYKQGLRYGLPLVANEIASVLLVVADRMMLRGLLGDFAVVGVYTIGYGLAINLGNMINYGIYAAYTQVSVREFETSGAAAVLKTKRSLLHVMVYLTTLLIVCLLVAGSDGLLLLAGGEKTSSVPVFVLTGINYMLDGLLGICTTGLILHKRSGTILALSLVALILNVTLNWFAIPRLGLMGAVYSTFISFIVWDALKYIFCPKDLRALPDKRATLNAVLLGSATWAIAHYSNLFGVVSHSLRIAITLFLVLIVFIIPALIIDVKLRESIFGYLRRNKVTITD